MSREQRTPTLVAELELAHIRTVRLLDEAGIVTVEQILALSERELKAIKGFGAVTVRDILEALAQVGLRLRPPTVPPADPLVVIERTLNGVANILVRHHGLVTQLQGQAKETLRIANGIEKRLRDAGAHLVAVKTALDTLARKAPTAKAQATQRISLVQEPTGTA